ncbi:MAG TPA: metalloregulator ArsR/SmtB family transcription factor [Solirubrobacteraceae bacterium]|nr:metalloregulator ArsR/SmtB family transcription factor [Solirubrobacteraceae bacterium]
MVQYSAEGLDRAFAALADSNRREIVRRLGTAGGATISELAGPLGMTLTGVKKHVSVLEGAGLVSSEKVGRARRCALGPGRLDEVEHWIGLYRQMLDERLDRLGELVEGVAPTGETGGGCDTNELTGRSDSDDNGWIRDEGGRHVR